jgi:hypothetical protein
MHSDGSETACRHTILNLVAFITFLYRSIIHSRGKWNLLRSTSLTCRPTSSVSEKRLIPSLRLFDSFLFPHTSVLACGMQQNPRFRSVSSIKDKCCCKQPEVPSDLAGRLQNCQIYVLKCLNVMLCITQFRIFFFTCACKAVEERLLTFSCQSIHLSNGMAWPDSHWKNARKIEYICLSTNNGRNAPMLVKTGQE